MLIVRTWQKLQLEYSTLPFWCGLLTKSPFQQLIIHMMPQFCLNHSPLLQNHKEGLIFLNEEIQTSKNISQGQIYQEISIDTPLVTYTGWSLLSTQIWPGINSCVVFSTVSMQWYWVSNVCMGASIKGRIAEMSGFLLWWLLWEWYWANAVQTLLY